MALSAPRVIRTTHTSSGTSVFASDSHVRAFSPFGPEKSAFTVMDVRNSVPVTNTDAVPSFAETLPRCAPGGTTFSLADITPGSVTPMHRTLSIDYGIVLSGEIVWQLDGGEEKTALEGDVIIQQGTNHQWLNKTDKTCRILFVSVSANKVVTETGEAFEETVFQQEFQK